MGLRELDMHSTVSGIPHYEIVRIPAQTFSEWRREHQEWRDLAMRLHADNAALWNRIKVLERRLDDVKPGARREVSFLWGLVTVYRRTQE